MLRHAGGVRVDHVIGLFRLWWVPRGRTADQGTYVRYDHEAMIGVLALEAARAGAVVVGEDLGVVEPSARDYLRSRGILGTSILWFERDGSGDPLPAEQWRELCMASVTTHDLPPTAGYLAGDHVRLRHDLGLLTRPLEEEVAADDAERESWLAEVRNRGLLADDADVEETVLALHALPHPDPVPAALRGADRRRGRPADPEPARHGRRVPELAGAPLRTRPASAAVGGGAGLGARRGPRAGGQGRSLTSSVGVRRRPV